MKEVSYRDWEKWRTVFITENNDDYYRYKWSEHGTVQYLKWYDTFWEVIATFRIKQKK